MNRSDLPVGVFDSGIGGLTVLKEIFGLMPRENTVYLGDTARVPYGIRSPETVTRYSFECADFLIRQEIKLLAVACNTVSAVSLGRLSEMVSIPVIGVIEPGARAAARATKSGRIGIIGTEATIRSGSYPAAIASLDAGIEVFGVAPRLFVPLAEEGWTEGEIARSIAEKYLADLKKKDIDTLVLGCTHYPLLKKVLSEVMGEGISLIDSAIETAVEIKSVLEAKSLLRNGETEAFHEYYVTDSHERFISVGENFLGRRMEHVEKITLGTEA